MKPTYNVSPDGGSITCMICGSISYNAGDIRNRYCARCGVFHDDLEACASCDEPILPGERVSLINHLSEGVVEPKRWHWECSIRSVVGGVNHQNGLCICCGGTEPPDPADMTRRQAAQAAATLWLARQNPFRNYGCEQETPKDLPQKTSEP